MANQTTAKFFVHQATIRYYDYRELLESVDGVMFSTTGRAQDAFSFERGVTVAEKLESVSDAPVGLVAIGERVERRSNMNPHGLV